MKEVIISIAGGVADLIGNPDGVRIVIRDYDIDDEYEGNVKVDKDGDKYQEIVL